MLLPCQEFDNGAARLKTCGGGGRGEGRERGGGERGGREGEGRGEGERGGGEGTWNLPLHPPSPCMKCVLLKHLFFSKALLNPFFCGKLLLLLVFYTYVCCCR
jgi:hypothetical protein